MALVQHYIPHEEIIYKEWMEDEIVIFSNQELPLRANAQDLLSYKWICRNPDSNTRKIFKESLEKQIIQIVIHLMLQVKLHLLQPLFKQYYILIKMKQKQFLLFQEMQLILY